MSTSSSSGTTKIRFSPKDQLKEIQKGAEEVLPESELIHQLEESYKKQIPLKVKFGADPSRPDLHLGHTVVLEKLKVFQDLGHNVFFLIGDFTARIGDPTGRNKARKPLSAKEVQENALTYQEQIFKILDRDKTKVVFNSEWLSSIPMSEFLGILMNATVGQILAREDFAGRFKSEAPIHLHEFMYPILQGYDSVALKADVELGGTDQKFNLLMGRHLQKCFEQRQQSLVIMPILEGLDGVQKMSKSFGNAIGLTETPVDMFGKLMSVSDQLMIRYYELLSHMTASELHSLKEQLECGKAHPMETKKNLAAEIVSRYHGEGIGEKERTRFEERFSKKTESLEDVPVVEVSLDAENKVNLVDLMLAQGFCKSKGEARRLLKQNAVKINGKAVQDERTEVETSEEPVLLKSGKLNRVRLKVVQE